MEPALSESKLLARRSRDRPVLEAGAKKLMVRPRSDRPVDDRFFFLASKSLVSGSWSAGVDVGMLDIDGCRGEPGDGGVFERVVVADLLIEKRRLPLLSGGTPLLDGALFPLTRFSRGAVERRGMDMPLIAGGCDVGLVVPFVCWPGVGTWDEAPEPEPEPPRRKMLVMVRLKLRFE